MIDTGDDCIEVRLARAGQRALLRRLAALDPARRSAVLDTLTRLPIARLVAAVRGSRQAGTPAWAEAVRPPRVHDPARDPALRERARAVGEAALRRDEVAVLTVAGGMSTRLGWSGPKGTFPIGPVTCRSLFALFAERIAAIGRRHGTVPRWIVQTSPRNDAATRAHFEAHGWFGLPRDRIAFVVQGQLPAFDAAGDIVLDARGDLVLQPDGHGGVFRALARAGTLDALADAGVAQIFLFQVDNPLCHVADPVFVGLHRLEGAQMSVKVVDKADPAEAVGVVVECDGRLRIVEYSELPASMAEARNPDGRLRFRAANTGIHVIDVAFARQMAGADLPLHVAERPVPTGDGLPAVPGFKLEWFVFDALPHAERACAVVADRAQEFAPVKRRNGRDTPAQARRALVRRYHAWIAAAGIDLGPLDPAAPVEVCERCASGPEELARAGAAAVSVGHRCAR